MMSNLLISPLTLINPAVSVIIPMYNAEKYIGECLDSLLAQTFQDFEVIVVDDCSTDNSVEIVKNYIPTFNGRLKLGKTETNSGGCAVPRNIGFPLSRGEYVYFMDSDDILTKTGLEEMYTLAKEYDADVVYCERYYMSTGVGEEFVNNIHIAKGRIQKPPYVDVPTLEPSDFSERVKRILNERYWYTAWLKLVRRDLLDKNKIIFSNVKPCEDNIWTYGSVLFAKKFLRVPNLVYIRRIRNDSIMGSERTPKQTMHFWLNPILLGLKELDDFMGQFEFFQNNPQKRYALLENHFKGKLRASFSKNEGFTSFDVYEAIKNGFGNSLGEYDVLISALCTHIFDQGELLKNGKVTAVRPAVSVIISMYNVETYIGECLDSILEQTFQNFEVVVVDDCSTDNSLAVVKSYMPKFNGRLKFTKTQQNTGKPGEPRNIGVDLSCGEYLLILDSDDTITPDAIEKMYKVAKEYNADVVTCEKFYKVPEECWRDRKNFQPHSYQTGGFVEKPTLISFDITKRIHDCLDTRFLWELWDKLVRRDFLVKNQIRSQTIMGQDFLVVYCLICTAKTFVRVPYVINFHRIRKDSLYTTNNECEPIQKMKAYLTALNIGLKYIDELLSKREFFQKNPEVKLLALNVFLQRTWNVRFKNVYDKITQYEFREALREEFGNSNIILTELLFDLFRNAKKEKNSLIPLNFESFVTARIDLKLMSSDGDFEILSVSDDKAKVSKPQWLQRNGSGYMITSYVGLLKFVAKSSVDGKISLNLRGIEVRDPADKSKRLPYWIVYAKLTVNENTIFDTLTPTWHDKPYRHIMDVKADDEIKIQVEWLPHRSDAIETKIETPTITAPAQKISTPSTSNTIETKIEIPKVIAPKLEYETARIDVKFVSRTVHGKCEILSLSDKSASVSKPAWLQKDGVGYQIQSDAGKLEFIAKTTADGQLNCNLKGIIVRNPNNPAGKISYRVYYTNLTVN